MPKPRFIGSEIYRHSRYGGKHPLAIPRVSLAADLCRALGWLPDAQYVDSPVATKEQLTRFHDPDYVAAVRQCERDGAATEDQRARFNLGVNGNPVFGEIFRRPATAAGATLHAIGLLEKGGIVFSPAGGTHHGLKDRASGFCFFNDPVLGISRRPRPRRDAGRLSGYRRPSLRRCGDRARRRSAGHDPVGSRGRPLAAHRQRERSGTASP